MLQLHHLTKYFGDTLAVADLSLEVEPGEFVTLLGPSGCGKTTTLRMIAGFETPTSGRILLDGDDVTGLSPQRRGIGMVFQNYALFPHLDVFENVAFGLKAQGTPRSELPERVARALERVDLTGYERRAVQQLSGGQQQRVALARALAPEPSVLLLDEPLSNLDAALRERTRAELRSLLKRLGVTVVFVTHDQEEAFALSDRVALLDGGRLQQLGAPETLYMRPANAFAASFLGRASFLDGRVVDRSERPVAASGSAASASSGGGAAAGSRPETTDRRAPDAGTIVCELAGGVRWSARLPDGGPDPEPATDSLRLMVRPESLRLLPAGADRRPADLPGRVLERRFVGAVTYYRVATEAGELLVSAEPNAAEEDDRVLVRVTDEAPVYAFAERRT